MHLADCHGRFYSGNDVPLYWAKCMRWNSSLHLVRGKLGLGLPVTWPEIHNIAVESFSFQLDILLDIGIVTSESSDELPILKRWMEQSVK